MSPPIRNDGEPALGKYANVYVYADGTTRVIQWLPSLAESIRAADYFRASDTGRHRLNSRVRIVALR